MTRRKRIQIAIAADGIAVRSALAYAGHEIAKRMREMAGMNPPAGRVADDITYPSVDGPSVFSHPLCQNTYRDGKFLGNESLPEFDRNQPRAATREKRTSVRPAR